MVEGPKVVLKVQRVQSLKGQCLEAMIVAPTQSTSQPLTTAMSKCVGRVVQSVWCLGKELFLTMAQRHENVHQIEAENEVIGIRLHFGMAGSERLVYTRTLPPGYHVQNLYVVARQMMPKQSRKKWDVCLIFNEQALFVYDSTVCTKTSHYLDNAYRSLIRDVMSYDKFSIDSVIQQIRESDQSRHIHEVIMDQSILPGVGNVIKIEGLFDAGMHPHCITSDIDDVWLSCLIRKLRDYARYWYDCCKGPGSSKPNKKNVYGRSNCGVCESVISLIRDGVLKRITYLCSKCQLLPAQHALFEARKTQRRDNPSANFFVPGKSKICLQSVNNAEVNEQSLHQNVLSKPRWVCLYCTLDNKFDLNICEICNTARPLDDIPQVLGGGTGQTALFSSCYISESNGFHDNRGDDAHISPQGKGNNSSGSFNDPTHGCEKNYLHAKENVNTSNCDSSSYSSNSNNSCSSSSHNNNSSSSSSSGISSSHNEIVSHTSQPKNDTLGITFITPQFCKCSVQGTLHRVRKAGPTNSRLFWSCSIRKCDFFSWADGSFPKCQHGAPCTVRRVLKPGPTNGQYFFSCSLSAKCEFFLWSSKHRPSVSVVPAVTVANNAQAVTLKRPIPNSNSNSNTGNSQKKMKPIIIPL